MYAALLGMEEKKLLVKTKIVRWLYNLNGNIHKYFKIPLDQLVELRVEPTVRKVMYVNSS